jgi:transcriptional regulator with XRE-family HTH domain
MATNDHSENGEKMAERQARAARIRAARNFADLDQATFAEALGVSVATVKRYERGTRDVSLDICYLLADMCGVPRAFMEHGFESTAPPATADVVLRAQETIVAVIEARMSDLTEALLTRDQALEVSRQALDRLRNRSSG